MVTKFIGLKELRQNMARISREAHKNNQRVIVLRKNHPLFELRPLSFGDALTETFRLDIGEAKKDARAGRVHSQREVEKIFGL